MAIIDDTVRGTCARTYAVDQNNIVNNLINAICKEGGASTVVSIARSLLVSLYEKYSVMQVPTERIYIFDMTHGGRPLDSHLNDHMKNLGYVGTCQDRSQRLQSEHQYVKLVMDKYRRLVGVHVVDVHHVSSPLGEQGDKILILAKEQCFGLDEDDVGNVPRIRGDIADWVLPETTRYEGYEQYKDRTSTYDWDKIREMKVFLERGMKE